MVLIRIVVGILLLALGRKLFWLFVGAVGFAVGFSIANQVFQVRPEWVALLVALGVGLVGALLAVFVERLAIALAGFLAAAYFVTALLGLLGIASGLFYWLAALAVGVVGAVLASVLFDWSLIVLSSLAGSAFIVQSTSLSNVNATLVFVVLLAVGIAVQAGLMHIEERAQVA